MSDVDKLYDADPRVNKNANAITEVHEITPELRAMAGGGGKWGTDGMSTKLDAGDIALDKGIEMVITHGQNVDDIYGILDGRHIGTRFVRKHI